MSEVLRDLVVSLSLDGDNFSRNLTSINKQIQEAESEFRRAASGVDNFEKSVSGRRASSVASNKSWRFSRRPSSSTKRHWRQPTRSWRTPTLGRAS